MIGRYEVVEEGGWFLVVPAGERRGRATIARAESEPMARLVAAALPIALLQDEPWVVKATEEAEELRVRDLPASGVGLEGIGVHAIRETLETLVSVTRTPESLGELLRGAPPEVVDEALRKVRGAG